MTYLLIILTAIVATLQIDNLKAANPINKKAWITLGFVIIATIITFFIECNRTNQEKQAKIKSVRLDSLKDSIANARTIQSNKVILYGIGKQLVNIVWDMILLKKKLQTLNN